MFYLSTVNVPPPASVYYRTSPASPSHFWTLSFCFNVMFFQSGKPMSATPTEAHSPPLNSKIMYRTMTTSQWWDHAHRVVYGSLHVSITVCIIFPCACVELIDRDNKLCSPRQKTRNSCWTRSWKLQIHFKERFSLTVGTERGFSSVAKTTPAIPAYVSTSKLTCLHFIKA